MAVPTTLSPIGRDNVLAYVFRAVVGPLILPHQFPEASTVAAELFSSPAVVLPVKLLLCDGARIRGRGVNHDANRVLRD